MPKSKSSQRWLKEHFSDNYVKKAQAEGVRSRAVYKLQAIQARDELLKKGMNVVDLGAAPGGWSEYALSEVGEDGCVIAMDILEMAPISGVRFIQGDFTDNETYEQLMAVVNHQAIDVVLSDMAPNFSGNKAVDQPKSMYLVELAFDFAKQCLKKDGVFLCKMFQGTGSEQFLKSLKPAFKSIKIRKPEASRARSREVYVLAEGFLAEK